MRAQGIEVKFTERAVDFLANEGYEPEFGARPLRRTIQRLVENELSRIVLAGSAGPSDRVTVDVADDRLDFQIEHGAPEQVKEEAGATHSA
jgi:ATP-dependent Clp protease ATP-binding subunit ClpC